MTELQKKKDTYRKLMAGQYCKPAFHISPEQSRAIYDAWVHDNGNITIEKLASQQRVPEHTAHVAIDKNLAEAFPKLIEFFGK